MLNLKSLLPAMKTGLGWVGTQAHKYAPQIMTGTGIVGFVATVVVGCKATLKAEEVLDKRDEMLAKAETALVEQPGEYSEEDYKKDIQTVQIKTIWNFVKLYAPTAALGLASIGLVLGGTHILNGRNAALAAAFKMAQNEFNRYRGNVQDTYGLEADRKLLSMPGKREKLPEKEAENQEPEEKKKRVKKSKKPSEDDTFSVLIDSRWRFWGHYEGNRAMILNAIKQMENTLNLKLLERAKHYVTANDMYNETGFGDKASGAGSIVGWILSKNDRKEFHEQTSRVIPNKIKLLDWDSEERWNFQNGYTDSIMLTPNFDGIIYELLD